MGRRALVIGARGALLALLCALPAAASRPAAATCPAPPLAPAAASIAERLLAARLERRSLPPASRLGAPLSLADAYAVQETLACALRESLGARVGYKLAFASRALQERFGMEGPAYAPLFASQHVPSGAILATADFAGERFHVETEIAFAVAHRIDRALESPDALRAYVGTLHVAFDMPERRYPWERGGAADAVADGLGGHRFSLGPGLAPADAVFDPASLRLAAERDGETVHEGAASAVMGDPWNALLWLTNQLVARGHPLEAGQVVLSGAAAPAYAATGDGATGRYLGRAGALPPVRCEVRRTRSRNSDSQARISSSPSGRSRVVKRSSRSR